ncbi:MAG: carboxypeptidase regulatory-like domain-containing protein, partial [Acidimicrobiia bacterium]
MRKIVVLLATALACAGLTLVASTSIAPPAHAADGSISGTVTDRVNGAPVSGAFLQLYWGPNNTTPAPSGSNRTFTSAADGTFNVAVPPGRYGLNVTLPSNLPYLPQGWNDKPYGSLGDEIIVGDGQSTGAINVQLRRGGTIEGTVRDEQGNPVVGARVTGNGPSAAIAFTGADGHYSLGQQPSTGVQLRVYADPLSNLLDFIGTELISVAEGATVTRDTTLATGAMLAGVVSGPSGPIAGAAIRINQTQYASTGADGSFSIRRLTPGLVTITAGAGASSPTGTVWYPNASSMVGSGAAPLVAGSTLTWNPTLPPAATISGTVTSSSGAPTAGSYVNVLRDGTVISGAQVGLDARYTIGQLAPGSYVARSGSTLTPFTITGATPHVLDLVMGPTGAISGLVTGPAGPAAGVTVAVEAIDGGFTNFAYTDANGRYTVPSIPPGNYVVRTGLGQIGGAPYANPTNLQVTYHPNGLGRGEARPVSVSGGATTANVDINASPGGRILATLSIIGGDDPRDLSAVAVPVAGTAISAPSRYPVAQPNQLAFDGLTPGRYRIFVTQVNSGPSYVPVAQQFLAGPTGAPLEIDLAAGQSIAVAGSVRPGVSVSGSSSLADGRADTTVVFFIDATDGLLRQYIVSQGAAAWSTPLLPGTYRAVGRTNLGTTDASWWRAAGSATTAPATAGVFTLGTASLSIGHLPVQVATASTSGVAGRITRTNGTPVAGALVTVSTFGSGTTKYRVTDADGRYSAGGFVGEFVKLTVRPPAGSGLWSSDETDGVDQVKPVTILSPGATTTVDRVLPTIAEVLATPPP